MHGSQIGAPSLIAHDILRDSSSSRVPSDGAGRAFNQMPDSFVETANRRALVLRFCLHDSIRVAWDLLTVDESQTF